MPCPQTAYALELVPTYDDIKIKNIAALEIFRIVLFISVNSYPMMGYIRF